MSPYILLFLSVFLWGEGLRSGDTVYLTIGTDTIEAEVAADFLSRQLGLQGRYEMEENQGMLFVFERERILSFWMKDTFLPLSIAFIDTNGVIIGIEDMEPLTLTPHLSPRPAKFALEVPIGWFRGRDIQVGDSISISRKPSGQKSGEKK